MPSHNEQVKPAAFDVAAPAPEESTTASKKSAPTERPSWMVPALLGLAVVAVLVVFWLPGRVGPAAVQTPEAADSPVASQPQAGQKKAVPAGPEATPWSDAQQAKLRKDAQETLEKLLEVQELLEDTSVALWAADAYEQAKTHATAGDSQYRERQFVEAKASYEQGFAGMQAILESTDDALAAQLEQARLAIEAGEAEQAVGALAVARAIEPGSELLATLTARVATLEQLLPLLTEAEAAEATGDLAGAQTLLEQAATLDPQHQRVAAQLQRVTAAHTAMRFNDAMSDGYQALDEARFSNARAAFKRAAALSPGSGEAASALEEVQVAQTAHRLSNLQQRGNSAESKEQWQAAVKAYEEALKIDANILFAHEGMKRSRVRAKLDKQFSSAIDEPTRLSDKAVADATATLLRQAANVTPRGPVLSGQISQLEVLLKQANTLRSLTLNSDGETDIIVYKVARLGQFQQRALDLRPGKYTAVGTRNGYRDVRVTFTLSHEGPLPAVNIRCTEPI
ncbi:MAG: hypothetical protein V7754_12345 [Halioglobus sp.]